MFLKKQRVMRHYHFFKFFDDDSRLPFVMFLYETHFSQEGGHSIAHPIFKTCVHFFKRMKPAYVLDIKHTVNFA